MLAGERKNAKVTLPPNLLLCNIHFNKRGCLVKSPIKMHVIMNGVTTKPKQFEPIPHPHEKFSPPPKKYLNH